MSEQPLPNLLPETRQWMKDELEEALEARALGRPRKSTPRPLQVQFYEISTRRGDIRARCGSVTFRWDGTRFYYTMEREIPDHQLGPRRTE